jgi:predicted secreted hydrolase
MMDTLRQLVPILMAQNPRDQNNLNMMTALASGRMPPPHKLLVGNANATATPFALHYGTSDSLVQHVKGDTDFELNIGDSPDVNLSMIFHPQSPFMAVGGTGETGLVQPTDMYYYSLTNCAVTGSVKSGAASDTITKGIGWFDHQWGSSWGLKSDGWDWWGLQLDNGEQVLLYRHRDLTTGAVFSPSATLMDAQGKQSVTSNIKFTPDASAVWTDPATKISYPLGWVVEFPDQKLKLHVQAPVQDQTIPTLGVGSSIWEGHVAVDGQEADNPVTGNGFMELVGYDSPIARQWVNGISK